MEITAIVKIPHTHNKLALLYAVYRFLYDIKTLYDVCLKNRLKKKNKHEARERALSRISLKFNKLSIYKKMVCVFFYLRIMPIDFGIKNRYGKRIFGIFEIQKAKKKMLIAIVGNIGELI